MVISMNTHKAGDGTFLYEVFAIEYQKPSIMLANQTGFKSRAIATARGKASKRHFRELLQANPVWFAGMVRSKQVRFA